MMNRKKMKNRNLLLSIFFLGVVVSCTDDFNEINEQPDALAVSDVIKSFLSPVYKKDCLNPLQVRYGLAKFSIRISMPVSIRRSFTICLGWELWMGIYRMVTRRDQWVVSWIQRLVNSIYEPCW